MKTLSLTFFSNFLNDHQIPFCDQMYRLLGDGFHFVATEPIWEERLKLGFKDVLNDYPYAINSFKSTAAADEAMRLGLDSDAVIIGSAPDMFIMERLKYRRLTFRYTERIFRKGTWRLLDPRVLRGNYLSHVRHRRNEAMHLLCASAYTASDMDVIFSYPGRRYKWGYFRESINDSFEELSQKKNNMPAKLLWAGRFIGLKHPEKAVLVTKQLKDRGVSCKLEMIGTGEMEPNLRTMVAAYSLNDSVVFTGSLPPAAVLERMQRADVFLATSDRQEGWGAVVNEAMSVGCAVIASDAIGSAPFLIQSGQNGYLCINNSLADLYTKTEELLLNRSRRLEFGRQAYGTMRGLWSAKTAAERLVALSQALLEGKTVYYQDGPCSGA